MRLPHKTIERRLFRDGYRFVIGVDEVGMGCLAGPVVVCAVALSPDFPHIAGIRDSKLLSKKQRETLAFELKKRKIRFQISLCYPRTIDKINIYQAARKAMRRAIARLATPLDPPYLKGGSKNSSPLEARGAGGVVVLVDGPHKISGLNLPQLAIIKGDRTVFAIACASVIAKVHRDRMMVRYAKRFPQYGFERHKGYGTKLHVAMLTRYGPTAIHRRSFVPVGQVI